MVYLAASDCRYAVSIFLMTLNGSRYLGNELSNPTMTRIVLQQWAPGHFEFERRDVEGYIAHDDPWIVTL